MRKNHVAYPRIKGVKRTFLIKGLNLDGLLNVARRKGIALYSVKKLGGKRMIVTVNLSESQKFFAIAKNLCYNITKVRDGGLFFPVYSLIKNFGLLLGGIVFVLFSVFINDVVFCFDFYGSGKMYAKDALSYMNSVGVKEFTRFSSLDLNTLADGILKNSDRFSFVSCQKQGNRMKVNLVLSPKPVGVLDGKAESLISDVDGVIESIKVYRGTARVKVGDTVQKGSLIVDGNVLVGENLIKTNVLATVAIIVEKEFTYQTDQDGAEDKALLFAEQEFSDREVLGKRVEKIAIGNEFIYKTTLQFRRVLIAG